MISIPGKAVRRQAGYSYILLLVAIIIVGIAAQTATVLNSHVQRRELEKELLYRGQAYQRAIGRYYSFHKYYPTSLDDLLRDSKTLNGKQYIRQLYPEPITGEWLLIRNGNKGIVGVSSSSEHQPLKQANFPLGLEAFANATQYREWQFIYSPPKMAN